MPAPSRVVDYFATLSVAKHEVNLDGRFQNVGLPLICSWRFPKTDFKEAEFPKDIGSFAFPDGARFEVGTGCPPNMHYSFVLTEADGGRIYCDALRFWREVNSVNLEIYCNLYSQYLPDLRNQNLYEPIVIVLLSHWPFFAAFEQILNILYKVTELHSETVVFPIERVLCNLIFETPLPPRGRTVVEYNCYGENIIFKRPPPNQRSLRNNHLSTLVHCLSMENIITLVGAILCEKRILFFSQHISILTPCLEAFCTLIFPFFWQHIYVPVLPAKFTDFVYAPMPFLCGVLPSYMPEIELLEGVIFVDLDTDCIKFHTNDPIPLFPRSKLDKYAKQMTSNTKKPLPINQSLDSTLVCDGFVRFFAKFLRDYKHFMNPNYLQQSALHREKFNKEKWIKENCESKTHATFYDMFVEAQMFQCFIDQRFEVDGSNYEVLYFDEKIDETFGSKATPFLDDSTFLHQTSKTYTVQLPIQSTEVECQLFSEQYHQYGLPLTFNEEYLYNIRAPPTLVTQKDLTNQPSMHMSFATIEFFRQKRLYDRHWHSLAAKVNQQNILFNNVLKLVMKWQDAHSRYIAQLNSESGVKSVLYQILQTGDDTNTNTSMDEPWMNLCQCLMNHISRYSHTFSENRRDCFLPLMESVPSQENALRVIIESARECESQTAQTKCEVESANKHLLLCQQKLRDKQSEQKSSSSSGSSNRHRMNPKKKLDEFIAAVEQRDKSSIEHVSSTTNFLTNLNIFSSTMPIMIDDVKNISKERINQLRKQLLEFVHTQRIMHESAAHDLLQVQNMIEKINGDQDIEQTFMEGSAAQVIHTEEKNHHDDGNNTTTINNHNNINNNNNNSYSPSSMHSVSHLPHLKMIRRQSFSHLSIDGSPTDLTSDFSIANLQKHIQTDENRKMIHEQLIQKFEANCIVYQQGKVSQQPLRISQSKLQSSSIDVIAENKESSSSAAVMMVDEPPKEVLIPVCQEIEIFTDVHGFQRVTDFLYSDNLWGTSAFQHILRQFEDGKNVIKGLIKTMEELSDVWDTLSKNLSRVCQTPKMMSESEMKCWKQLRILTDHQSAAYRKAEEKMREHIFDLKVTKAELKSTVKLLQKKKTELNNDVQYATRNVQIAYDERNACLRIFRQSQSQWKQLQLNLCPIAKAKEDSPSKSHSSTLSVIPSPALKSSSTSFASGVSATADLSNTIVHKYISEEQIHSVVSQMTLAQFNYKQADAKWERAKSVLRGIKQRHDLCNGVILDSFREKEIIRQSQIMKCMASLVNILFELISNIHCSLVRFVNVCMQLNVDEELHQFVDEEIRSSAAMLDKDAIRWTIKSVELSWKCNKSAIASAKAIVDFFQLRSSGDQHSRNFHRRNTMQSNIQVKFGYSINDLTNYFCKFIKDLSSVSMEYLISIKSQLEPCAMEMKKTLETQNNASHQFISDCTADFNKLEDKLARSVIDCIKYESTIDQLKNRIQDKDNPQRERKKFQLFSKSKQQLQTDLSSAQSKLKMEISNRDRLKSQLQQKSKYRDVLFSKVITDFIRHEEYRLQMYKYLYLAYSKMTEEALNRVNDLAIELKANVAIIDVQSNIEKFVLQNRSDSHVPKIVLEHASFQVEQQMTGQTPNLIQILHKNCSQILQEFSTGIDSNQFLFSHQLSLLTKAVKNATLVKSKRNSTLDLRKNHNQLQQLPQLEKFPLTLLPAGSASTANKLIHFPHLKQKKLNAQIQAHLLDYVRLHSMKGGKHSRIASLHSISTHAKIRSFAPSNSNSRIKFINNDIDEEEEEKEHIFSTKGYNNTNVPNIPLNSELFPLPHTPKIIND